MQGQATMDITAALKAAEKNTPEHPHSINTALTPGQATMDITAELKEAEKCTRS